jgi:hypothetical protein
MYDYELERLEQLRHELSSSIDIDILEKLINTYRRFKRGLQDITDAANPWDGPEIARELLKAEEEPYGE